MPDEIVEVAEGDEGSDSLMNVVLLFAFLFVCYKAAEHFGWINKQKETGVPSGTPATTSEAAGAVTGSVMGAVTGAVAANAVTGTVTGSGTGGVPGSGTGGPGTVPSGVYVWLMSSSESLSFYREARGSGKIVVTAPQSLLMLVDGQDAALVDSESRLKLLGDALALAGDAAYKFRECLGIIRADSIVVYVACYLKEQMEEGVPLGLWAFVCLDEGNFEKLAAKNEAVRGCDLAYVYAESDGEDAALSRLVASKNQPMVYSSVLPYESRILSPTRPRVSRVKEVKSGQVYYGFERYPAIRMHMLATDDISAIVATLSAGRNLDVALLRGGAPRELLDKSTLQRSEFVDVTEEAYVLDGKEAKISLVDGKLKMGEKMLTLIECVGVITAKDASSITYVVCFVSFAITPPLKQLVTLDEASFGLLYTREKLIREDWVAYICADVHEEVEVLKKLATKMGVTNFSQVKVREVVPNESHILPKSRRRLLKKNTEYGMYQQPAPAPQPTTASTSIAGAPTPPASVLQPVPVPNTPAPGPPTLTEAEKMWMDAPDARKVFWVTSNRDTGIAGYYSYKAPGMWLKAGGMNAALEECTLKLTGTQPAVVYKGTAVVVSCKLSTTGSCTTYYHTVKSRLRPTSGMWNGASMLQMTWLGGEIRNFVPFELSAGLKMRDVWRSQNKWFDAAINRSIYLYLTESGLPHVGGPPRRAETENEGYVLYRYEELRLTYYAYWSDNDRSWKWHFSTNPCDIVVRKV